MRNSLISLAILLSLIAVILLGGLHWTVNRIYVPEGESVMLRYKGPLLIGSRNLAKSGEFAEDGQIGIREQMLGPGRHFYCPIWWERVRVPDVVVKTGEVAIVTSKLGEPLPPGEFLVDGELSGPNRARHQGLLRKVLGPGRYRMNPYAYEVNKIQTERIDLGGQQKIAGWVDVPTGYVGVVTYLANHKAANRVTGIQNEVLPPGLYPINPREQHVDIIEVGYRETSISVTPQMKRGDVERGKSGDVVLSEGGEIARDESGEPIAIADSGISFPSNDGFDIQLDFTAIWGVMPKNAPDVVRTFGSIEQAERKVIQPQSESICRNNGSRMSAVELLVGDTRTKFQTSTSQAFQDVLRDKHLTLLYGLIRHIYIPREVRVPIQQGYIADELRLTREQEKITATVEADFEEAKKKVELEASRIRVETDKLVANAMAEGESQASEIRADTAKQVAEVQRQIAQLDAQRTIKLGKAEADAQRLQEEAKAEKFELAVQAFGSPEAYSKWEFAEGLPESIELKLFYAGEGTLWTDLQGVMPTIPLKNPK